MTGIADIGRELGEAQLAALVASYRCDHLFGWGEIARMVVGEASKGLADLRRSVDERREEIEKDRIRAKARLARVGTEAAALARSEARLAEMEAITR